MRHPEMTLPVGAQPLLKRTLVVYLLVTTVAYVAGVTLTLFPPTDRIPLANPTGGILAIVLGVGALVWLWLRPSRPGPATAAACLATPIVIAFHVLMNAQILCLIATMMLAMYLRVAYPRRQALIAVTALTVATFAAMIVSPAPNTLVNYLIPVTALPAIAATFGALTRALVLSACTDPLTGVLNRAGWEISVADLPRHVRRAGPRTTVTVVALDIDHFKAVNDTHGHLAGDRRLIDLARTCTELVPPLSTVARTGGDEFAICLIGDDDAAADVVARLTRALPNVTIATAAAPLDGADPTALHAEADRILVRRKRGRTED
ncbi:MAG: GGDEF domain-containing protein [Gordonia sp. (in: high G+C Gram-positive bacteria)]|uniref:GGDEF domain-containing protein n=1 Tax=Gordonia sp. (in: high G+C Gram-positive bacteria) TaxID=84139 RepID=UPI0039E5B90E